MSTLYWPTAQSQSKVGCVFCKILPKRVKRIVVLASLYGFIVSDQFDEFVATKKLNKELNLCDDPQSLRLPLHLGAVLWNSEGSGKVQVPNERLALYKLATSIVQRTPASMRYGDRVEMRADVLRVLYAAV